MRIIFVRSREDGVGHYRCSIPALALRERGHTVDIVNGDSLKGRVDISLFAGYDACIVQKAKLPQFYHHIQVIPEDRRPKVVWECDDLVTGLRSDNPSFNDYAPHREGFVEFMRLSDALIVSTEELAACYSRLNAKCHVVPNFLDAPGLRDWENIEPREFSERVVIGWLGGIHHVGDEKPMAEGLRRALEARPNALFGFCGNADLGTLWKRSLGIPDAQWHSFPTGEFDGYQRRISQFDIGVAPLAQHAFNRCKSDLRLLEYGAWGVPYVASAIAPYARFHKQSGEVGGSLAVDAGEWKAYLVSLIDDFWLRKRKGHALKEYVWTHRGNAACGVWWETVIGGILADATPTRKVWPEEVTRNTFCPCGSGVKYKRCCVPAWG